MIAMREGSNCALMRPLAPTWPCLEPEMRDGAAQHPFYDPALETGEDKRAGILPTTRDAAGRGWAKSSGWLARVLAGSVRAPRANFTLR